MCARRTLALLLLVAVLGCPLFAQGIPEAITYQGKVTDSTGQIVPDGTHSMRFRVYDASSAGNQLFDSGAMSVATAGGVFTVILQPISSTTLTGANAWMETTYESTALPRVRIVSAPFALRSGDCWHLTGNSGTTPGTHYIGTSDNQALEIKANGARVVRLEPTAGSPNVISGHAGNGVTSGVVGATIGGGGALSNDNSVTDNYGTVAGGTHNRAGNNSGTVSDGNYSTVGGGDGNVAGGRLSTVAGGAGNTAGAFHATVGGGAANIASADESTVSGGNENTASGPYAAVPGGRLNTAAGDYSFAAGRRAKANHPGAFVWGDSTDADVASTANDEFVVRANGGLTLTVGIGGFQVDPAFGYCPNIIGGYSGNVFSSVMQGCVIAGGGKSGYINKVTDNFCIVSGGQANRAGDDGPIDASCATVSGGTTNVASHSQATVGGGSYNTASGYRSTIPGGHYNSASGDYSLAAGRRAQAVHNGALVWGDSTDADVVSERANQFRARANGGARFDVNNSGWVNIRDHGTDLIKASNTLHLTVGGVWTNASDAARKANFADVDARRVLDKLAAMPVRTWNYKTESEHIRHMGPTAQDFAAAFGLGGDDKSIGTIDADGVALAAIKGLYDIVQRQSERIEQLEHELALVRQSGASCQPEIDR